MGILAQILALVAPIVMEEIKKYREDHAGEEPTSEQIQQIILDKNVDAVLDKVAAWHAAHPRSSP